MKRKIYCSLCGAENYPLLQYCDNCGHILKTSRIKEEYKYDAPESFFTGENLDRIQRTTITAGTYEKILNNIRDIGLMNLKLNDNESCVFRVYKLVQQFSKLQYNKKEGAYGYYTCNNIYIDDSLSDGRKITTMIHELAHHLFSEIYEQLLMYIFNSKKSILYEAYVMCMTIQNIYMLVANEYLAYTVEGYFTNNAMKDYASVFGAVQGRQIDPEFFHNSCVVGKSIAADIIGILEVFLPENFRKEIKLLVAGEGLHPVHIPELENVEIISNPQEKINLLKYLFVENFKFFMNNPEEVERIDEIVIQFKQINLEY